ncbi:hypothetical protein D3C83_98310 [compost metagenome]
MVSSSAGMPCAISLAALSTASTGSVKAGDGVGSRSVSLSTFTSAFLVPKNAQNSKWRFSAT